VLHADGSVAVDSRCETSLRGVFACGVCIAVPHAVTGLPTWTPQAAVADKSAQVAGACAAGGDATLEPVVGAAIVRAGAVTIARSGLTREEAVAFVGADVDAVQVHVPSHDTFLPGAKLVSIELVYRRSSGEILGAQVAGGDGADKRADVLATAVHAGMSVEQIAMLDLSYAASYSSARDPVNVAGAVAASARAGHAEAWSAERVWAHKGAITLVDVRGAADRDVAGTLEGAKKLPLAALRGGLSGLPAGKPLVFFCDTGRHGYLAARIAKAHGREAAYLSGGLRSWVGAGRRLAAGKR
jgi:rhodanese-related sulfurtransferase